MKPSILLVGQPSDPTIAAVRQALRALGYQPLLLDRAAALQTTLELETADTLVGRLHLPTRTLDLAEIQSLYLRPLEAEPRQGESSDVHLQTLQDILYSWADLTPALVLNRPTPMASNDSKPFQAAWLQRLGFRVPDTLLTTDSTQAEAFWHRHGRVIYKSMSGTRSIVSELTAAHRTRFPDLATCPTQFQQFVPGQDIRVHVVADKVFPTAIQSDATDYRYAEAPFESLPCELPEAIASLCRQAAQAMDLTLAGLDLRRTPEGEWFCFEVNPSPAFPCFDDPVTQPIAQAIAHLLISAPPSTSSQAYAC